MNDSEKWKSIVIKEDIPAYGMAPREEEQEDEDKCRNTYWKMTE